MHKKIVIGGLLSLLTTATFAETADSISSFNHELSLDHQFDDDRSLTTALYRYSFGESQASAPYGAVNFLNPRSSLIIAKSWQDNGFRTDELTYFGGSYVTDSQWIFTFLDLNADYSGVSIGKQLDETSRLSFQFVNGADLFGTSYREFVDLGGETALLYGVTISSDFSDSIAGEFDIDYFFNKNLSIGGTVAHGYDWEIENHCYGDCDGWSNRNRVEVRSEYWFDDRFSVNLETRYDDRHDDTIFRTGIGYRF